MSVSPNVTADAFVVSTRPPWGMLERREYEGIEHLLEKEINLAYILKQCLLAGNLHAVVKTVIRHDDLVKMGLLENVDGGGYRLTDKAITLLYPYYSKERARVLGG